MTDNKCVNSVLLRRVHTYTVLAAWNAIQSFSVLHGRTGDRAGQSRIKKDWTTCTDITMPG